jgi:hypothetical protein
MSGFTVFLTIMANNIASADYDPTVAACFNRLNTRIEIAQGIGIKPRSCKDVSAHLKKGFRNVRRIARELETCLKLAKIDLTRPNKSLPGDVDLGGEIPSK